MFKGSNTGNYLTIEPNADSAVPVAAWSISEQDERNLDRYEGYPSFYYKKTFFVVVHKADSTVSYPVKAFAYIMHEDRKPGIPTDEYMERCREGYKAFGFDPTFLDEAYKFSCR